MFGKLAGVAAAFAAIAAAAVVCLVAVSFAIYAGLRDLIGPAWAAAAVAGIVALIAIVLALVVTAKGRPKRPKGEPPTLTAKLIEIAKERPLIAAVAMAAAAAAAATVAVKNPRLLTAVVVGLFAPPAKPPKS